MSVSLIKSRIATCVPVGDGVLSGGESGDSFVLTAVIVSTGGLAWLCGDVDAASFALPCFFLLPGLMLMMLCFDWSYIWADQGSWSQQAVILDQKVLKTRVDGVADCKRSVIDDTRHRTLRTRESSKTQDSELRTQKAVNSGDKAQIPLSSPDGKVR